MFKTVLLTLLTLLIAVGGGAASVWLMLEADMDAGAVTVGEWSAYPDAGTERANPYARARFAREGGLALGQAEGIAFVAAQDSAGAPLSRRCSYVLEGPLPPARFWTLYAADGAQAALPPRGRRAAALHSRAVLRRPDGSLALAVGPRPRAGNWLATGGDGPMLLVLTLFDTPVANGGQVLDIALPQVLRTGCDG